VTFPTSLTFGIFGCSGQAEACFGAGSFEYAAAFFSLTIDEADIEEDTEKTKDNEIKFRGITDLGSFDPPKDVEVTVSSSSSFNSFNKVEIPAAEFSCDAVECVAEVDDSSQMFQDEPLSLEVTIAIDGSTFDVEAENVATDVDNPPVTLTLTLKVGDATGTDSALLVEKDPGERLQFETPHP